MMRKLRVTMRKLRNSEEVADNDAEIAGNDAEIADNDAEVVERCGNGGTIGKLRGETSYPLALSAALVVAAAHVHVRREQQLHRRQLHPQGLLNECEIITPPDEMLNRS